MSINGEQTEDLNGDLPTDGDTPVETPSLLPSIDQKVTIIPENKQFKDQAVTLTEEYEAKLPLMDVQLKVVDGKQSKLMDMEDVADAITTKGTVDQDTSEEVNEAFEGLYDDSLTKNHFTAAPSGINLQRVKAFMTQKIAMEEQELQSSFTELLARPVETANKMLMDIKHNYLPSLLGQVYFTRNEAASIPERIASSQNLMVMVDRDFINLSKVDLSEKREEALNVNGNPRFDQLCANLNELFEDKSFKAHVLAMSNEEPFIVQDNKEQVLEYSTAPVLIFDLVKFYMNNAIIPFVEQLYDTCDAGVARLEEFKKEGLEAAEKTETIREFLTFNMVEITEASQNQAKLFTTVRNMIILTFLTQEFFDFFSKQ